MITEYVTDMASQMNIKLSKVVLTEGKSLGCLDAHLLSICSGSKLVSEFIHQSELDNLLKGSATELLELKTRASLERLKMQLVP